MVSMIRLSQLINYSCNWLRFMETTESVANTECDGRPTVTFPDAEHRLYQVYYVVVVCQRHKV